MNTIMNYASPDYARLSTFLFMEILKHRSTVTSLLKAEGLDAIDMHPVVKKFLGEMEKEMDDVMEFYDQYKSLDNKDLVEGVEKVGTMVSYYNDVFLPSRSAKERVEAYLAEN